MKRKILLAGVIVLIIVAIVIVQQIRQVPEVQITNQTKNTVNVDTNSKIYQEKLKRYSQYQELQNPSGFLNVENVSIGGHIGKNVILIDFWTYSCINCQRTLPYLNAWHEKYKDKGLVIIGVHTPEFDFEKKYENVQKAVEKYNVSYAVVQDNDYQTWRAYNNRYWPRKYLIDIDGFIVYDHIGEGSYEETEKKIQQLLKERMERLDMEKEEINGVVNVSSSSPNYPVTSEIYFGYGFQRNQLGNSGGWKPGQVVNYSLPGTMEKHKFYLSGSWLNNKDNMELYGTNGEIHLTYVGKQINLVAGSDQEVEIEIIIDGRESKVMKIGDYDLYNLYSGEYNEHEIVIKAKQGLRAYTFTFG